METSVLSYLQLAPMFVLDKQLEPEPELFRLQGNRVMFVIPFSEYLTFVDKCLCKVDYLYFSTKDIKKWLRECNYDNLYRSYLVDMSVAIGKELHYAYTRVKDASYIKHTSDAETKHNLEIINALASSVPCNTCSTGLRTYLSNHDFKLPDNPDMWTINNTMWNYAKCLYYIALQPNIYRWEFDIS